MGSQPVAHFFPELLPEIHFDHLLPKDLPGHPDLWYGPGGNTTGLHFDPQYNFFMQLYGIKRFLLSEPSSFSKLSPRSAFSKYPRVTDFNPLKPDFDRFPKARRVKFYDVTMEPGSILYLAPYWWHQVMSYTTIISLNIWLETPKLMANRCSVQMLPTYLKTLLAKTLFAQKVSKKPA
jgi:ribosomal protein L16 Arg81 hydroxylase